MPLLITLLCALLYVKLGEGFVVSPLNTGRIPQQLSNANTSTEESDTSSPPSPRPVALVTGVSRSIGIGKAVAQRLTDDGFQVVAAGWKNYDDRMPWGSDNDELIDGNSKEAKPFEHYYEVDLEDPVATEALIPRVVKDIGQEVSALVLCHCESVDSDIITTTVESFDRHMAVNARATWQLIQGLTTQFKDQTPCRKGPPRLRIVSITSDHTAGNLPYGASKGAMDRIVLAAAEELKDLGITSNVINPGATDTGWMSPEITDYILAKNLQPRIGQPSDVANLVSFLCSEQGQWINGQILYSDGGRL